MEIKKNQMQKGEKPEKRKRAAKLKLLNSTARGEIAGQNVVVSAIVPPVVASAEFLTEPAAILEITPLPDQKLSQPEEHVPPGQYLYVYGIIDNKEIALDFKGLRDAPLAKINFKDLAVLFSFYPALHPLVEEKEAMLHAQILNKIADKTTIIPMAFGTVFKDQEILETVLAKSYPQAQKTLELIKDKIELGIKVVKKGSAEEISEETSTAVNQEILKELDKLSVKSVAGDKFSDHLLLNNSFLVEKHKFTHFSDKVGELEEKHPNVKILYSGPWPAYSFVNINIKVG